MARSKEFLRCRDIDWAVKIGANYIHVASAGGDLPKIVEDKLFDIWRELKNTEYVDSVVILNESYLNEKFANLNELDYEERDFRVKWYVLSFREMAKRGFYSFDRDIRTPIDDSKYRLVAKPERMKVIPNYNFPEINLLWTPEELDGQNIVALIDEAEDRMQREKR